MTQEGQQFERTIGKTIDSNQQSIPIAVKCGIKIEDYYLRPSLSDVQFVIEGKTLFGHKLVLSAKSKQLEKMFFGKSDEMIGLGESPI